MGQRSCQRKNFKMKKEMKKEDNHYQLSNFEITTCSFPSSLLAFLDYLLNGTRKNIPYFYHLGCENYPYISQEGDLFFYNIGELAEQFIGQHLLYSQPTYMKAELYHWHREKAQSNAKIDYVSQQGNFVLPIEVKSGRTGTLKSLHTFMELKQLTIALRFSTNTPLMEKVTSALPNSNYQFTLVNLPLYLVGQTKRLMREIFGKYKDNQVETSSKMQ